MKFNNNQKPKCHYCGSNKTLILDTVDGFFNNNDFYVTTENDILILHHYCLDCKKYFYSKIITKSIEVETIQTSEIPGNFFNYEIQPALIVEPLIKNIINPITIDGVKDRVRKLEEIF